MEFQADFLSSVVIAYRGLENLILRYADEAETRAAEAEGDRRQELLEIARVCRKISTEPPATFHEAVQLLWFAHLGTIMESFEFINYGRLDVILGKYLGDTPREEAAQLIECLLLKMYDQVDLVTTYLGKYAAQLVVTLGGVLPDGENAVNGVTMLFLDAIDKIRLPEPEFNLRLHSKNPPEFLDRAAELTVSGCNFISYYNDDLFVESLTRAGIPQKDARSYGFDLCQDINIPGKGDFWLVNSIGLSHTLMGVLSKNCRYETFDELVAAMKEDIADAIRNSVEWYNEAEEQLSLYASGDLDAYFDGIKNHGKPVDRRRNSPMAPLPLLSALFHGSLEKALDVAFEPYPILAKGIFIGGCVEAINSLAAIRRIVYEQKRYSLDAVYAACKNNFEGDGEELLRRMLWNCPKWGNDDDAVDDIAVDILEYSLRECEKYKTFLGGQVLGGIHQPHPILNGNGLMATPEGRKSGVAVAVTLSPESGTMKNGPTAALSSAAKIDPMLVQWNFCVMVNYFS
jgi:formate C-acetyltransferase